MDDRRDELASAYLDGEASADEVALVEGDQELLDRVAVLRRAAAAVAIPVGPRPDADRDAAIVQALADTSGGGGVADLGAARVRRASAHRPGLRVASVAAAVLALVVLAPLLANLGDDDGDDTATGAGPATTILEATADDAGQAAQQEAGTEVRAGAGSAAGPPFGPPLPDLGALESRAELDDAADTLLSLRSSAGDGQGTGAAPTTTTFAVAAELDADESLYACLAELAAGPGVAVPVAAGRATWEGEPAVVLAYERADGSLAVVAAVADGCRVVARG